MKSADAIQILKEEVNKLEYPNQPYFQNLYYDGDIPAILNAMKRAYRLGAQSQLPHPKPNQPQNAAD